MNFLIVLLAKLARFVLHKKGGGTSFPGRLALKLNKNILNYFELPKITIFVTGTTGKTSISGTLDKIFTEAGYKTVSNIKGSNLLAGVVTTVIDASKLNGKTSKDVLIVEVDERYVKLAFKYITPTHFIINNLSRDQLARNGHQEIVFNEINKSIKKDTHLFLNADDPLVTKFSLDKENEITFFGLKKNTFSNKKNQLNTLDLAYCPKCHKKLQFDYFNYGNLGYYKCPNGDYERPKCIYEGELKNKELLIDGMKIKLENETLFNAYNLTACYNIARVCGVESEKIVNTLSNLNLHVKRVNEFTIDKTHSTILLSKNETPISYNQSLEYISTKKEKKTVAIGFTRISGRYDLKDISWLYDINFELLNDKSIEKIILIGPFCYDLAVRLKTGGINPKKFVFCKDHENSLDFCLSEAIGNLYFVVYFDLDYAYLDILKSRGVIE